ncbi:MAG: LPS export ABC transporter periplasmic protein LptC [Pacificimonas sp.]
MSKAARQLAEDRRAWALPGSGWDRATKILRRAFPVAAALILLAGLIWPLTQDREFSFILSKDRVEMAGDRMRLGQAVYRGEDARGRPFMIRAESGLQQSSADPKVALVALRAQIEMEDGLATVTAPRGVYDLEKERLLVSGPVKINRPSGYRVVTSDVLVDIPTRQVISDDRVVGAVPLGTFAADTLSIDVEERVLVLEGNVKMRINPR